MKKKIMFLLAWCIGLSILLTGCVAPTTGATAPAAEAAAPAMAVNGWDGILTIGTVENTALADVLNKFATNSVTINSYPDLATMQTTFEANQLDIQIRDYVVGNKLFDSDAFVDSMPSDVIPMSWGYMNVFWNPASDVAKADPSRKDSLKSLTDLQAFYKDEPSEIHFSHTEYAELMGFKLAEGNPNPRPITPAILVADSASMFFWEWSNEELQQLEPLVLEDFQPTIWVEAAHINPLIDDERKQAAVNLINEMIFPAMQCLISVPKVPPALCWDATEYEKLERADWIVEALIKWNATQINPKTIWKYSGTSPHPLLESRLVSIQTLLTNNYLTAVNGGGQQRDAIHTTATAIGEWEQFRLIPLFNGEYAIQTVSGHYLTAVNGGGLDDNAIHTDATAIGAWERFKLIDLGPGLYAIQTLSGHNLSATNGGDVAGSNAITTGPNGEPGDWEQFLITDL